MLATDLGDDQATTLANIANGQYHRLATKAKIEEQTRLVKACGLDPIAENADIPKSRRPAEIRTDHVRGGPSNHDRGRGGGCGTASLRPTIPL
jgi:hypothetical protein